ncbi:MAG: hypothetical protein A2402_03340 [Candidatus Staskawiczbacteria bacterium RIFOXYC1_FULL_37_43]|nr:MAG: hypothetical protein A2813_03630 [Candidatus Staskawiczbacteria bacterium RIFCSPHIGHO2_01_FULL_37_17]OGZ71295.1 MAG: hypothetical protein A2891_00205 [Candidatus Staskawiczbacteria bacterium RIFCSPLOWO2_01_FULL_37_19]OGZ76377.1 MAG: hypothetical protein A2205_01290 [Candidatus Staskawiczbacteria bacterium RIFOXYA1_FULL_37_15]OGZ77382.1 MAG: hypothetical protein A2280_00715 [Candidatus Staskawiczbacteria bacterium RIFOXYA12_FULL_37_10]OGZ80393.1 MAG: hypothetical protein A2353_04000 [Can
MALPLPGNNSPIQNNRLDMLKKSSSFAPQKSEKSLGASFIKKGTSLLPKKKEETKKEAPKSPADTSIFGGKSEISRIELRQKLRKDANVWNAERQVGLSLSPSERASLEKEVFSQALGRDISKRDLNFAIKKMNQKRISANSFAEKEKLRKQINFFKKIGGI